MSKLRRLKEILQRYQKVGICYSGGVDSTFLLYFTKEIAGCDVVAFTAISETYTGEELKFARFITKKYGVRHVLVRTKEFDDRRFTENPVDRCFYCKSELFARINNEKERLGLDVIFDGTNFSDRDDFRPGGVARKKYGIISPLELAGLTKTDIRKYSEKFGIDGFNRPPNACLASRIPYGVSLDRKVIRNIAEIERFLRALGIEVVRLRHHNDIARIETSVGEIRKILLKRDKIVKRVRRYGYKYVTVDIEGYRTGSMNVRTK